MVIIDLDNCSDGMPTLEEDIATMPEILFIGISRNDDLLDKMRGVLNAERKPFKTETFILYKNEVLKRLESEHVINKEDNRLYDDLGINLVNDFSNANMPIEKRLDILKSKIDSSENKLEKEKDFLKNTGLDKVILEKATVIETKVVNVTEVIKDDAILKYRIRKLMSMNLSKRDIDDKIAEIMNYNQTISTSKPKMSNSEKDILEKLRSGFYAPKKRSFQERKAEKESINKRESNKEVVEEPKQEESKQQIPIKTEETNKPLHTPPLKKPIIRQDPPMKEDKPVIEEDKNTNNPHIFKRPSFKIGSNNDIEDNNVKKEQPPSIPLKKPAISLNSNNDMKHPPMKKPMINIEEESKPALKKPIVGIETKDMDIQDDPLTKLREQRRKSSIQNNSKTENKTIISNKNDEKEVKDNSGIFERKSLVESMKEKIKFGTKSQYSIEEELRRKIDKKSKPPR